MESKWVVAGGLAAILVTAYLLWPTPRNRGDLEVAGPVEKPADPAVPRVGTAPVRPQGDSDAMPVGQLRMVGATLPAVDSELNADTRSVAQGYREQIPERFAAEFFGPAFDPETYASDPDTYLHTVEPSRALRSASPGPDVPAIGSEVGAQSSLRLGESIRLTAQVPASMPVTFTSFNGGQFENRLPSITVAADAEGRATAVYTASGSAEPKVGIMAASPIASGKLRYRIHVERTADTGS